MESEPAVPLAVAPCDHNEHYHGFLLRQLRARMAHVLGVGCGTGTFACRLAERADAVDAIDVSPQMIAAARLRHPMVSNVRWLVDDVLTVPLSLSLGYYDAVTAVACLHHMPLEAGLSRPHRIRASWWRPRRAWAHRPISRRLRLRVSRGAR